MKDFKRPNRFGGGNKFGGGGRREGGYERPQMHAAVCDQCGKDCEVPFRPTGQRPVYCKECFGGAKPPGGNAPTRSFVPREAAAPAAPTPDKRLDEMRRQMDVLDSKLNRILQAFEGGSRPTVQATAPREASMAPPVVVSAPKPALAVKSTKKKVVKKAAAKKNGRKK